MKLGLLRIGNPAEAVIHQLAADLRARFDFQAHVMPEALDPADAYHWERQQVHSSELLREMQPYASRDCDRVLAITDRDLYIPILTFVFGEAQMEGPCAVVSTHRLRQEFYGLPADSELLRQRLAKEAVHELGHTLGLVHCEDYSCVMASSHSVEAIDLKEGRFCEGCRLLLKSAARPAQVGASGVF